MRTTRAVLASALVSTLLILGLALPSGVLAKSKPKTVLGSLTITKGGGTPLTTELVGFALIANPGLEKTIVVQIPPFTLPFFVDGDVDDEGGEGPSSSFVTKRFDTTLVVTNTTSAVLIIELTVHDTLGKLLLDKSPVTLAAHASKLISLATLLP